jgi:sulfite reductase (ferredoxin)
LIEEFKQVPPYEVDRTPYSDWGDPREFSMGDLGIGECAGEVISRTDMELSIAESVVFEAQLALEEGDLARADERSYQAMIAAARGVVALELPILPPSDDDVVREFRERFYDTKLFFDRFAHGKFARPLFARHESGPVEGADAVRELVEETQLFIDASHACQIRVAEARKLEVVA